MVVEFGHRCPNSTITYVMVFLMYLIYCNSYHVFPFCSFNKSIPLCLSGDIKFILSLRKSQKWMNSYFDKDIKNDTLKKFN